MRAAGPDADLGRLTRGDARLAAAALAAYVRQPPEALLPSPEAEQLFIAVDVGDFALRIAQTVNDDNKGNVLQIRGQKLISEIIERPSVEVSPDLSTGSWTAAAAAELDAGGCRRGIIGAEIRSNPNMSNS